MNNTEIMSDDETLLLANCITYYNVVALHNIDDQFLDALQYLSANRDKLPNPNSSMLTRVKAHLDKYALVNIHYKQSKN